MSLDNEIKGIKAVLVFDIIGRPPEHLVNTLGKIVEEMDKEKGVRVNSKKIHEPVLLKERNDFYTSFAEVEVEVEKISLLAMLMFKYMPAHVEVISPELIALSNGGWSDILTELTVRLHSYEEVTRMATAEKSILEKRLRELLGDNKQQGSKPEKTDKLKALKAKKSAVKKGKKE